MFWQGEIWLNLPEKWNNNPLFLVGGLFRPCHSRLDQRTLEKLFKKAQNQGCGSAFIFRGSESSCFIDADPEPDTAIKTVKITGTGTLRRVFCS